MQNQVVVRGTFVAAPKKQ